MICEYNILQQRRKYICMLYMYVIHVELFYVSPDTQLASCLTENLSGDEKSSPMAWSPLKLISPLAKKYMAMLHAARENSITGSQKNIQAKLKGKELPDSEVSTVVMNENMKRSVRFLLKHEMPQKYLVVSKQCTHKVQSLVPKYFAFSI